MVMEILQLLQTAYREDGGSRMCFEWCKHFREGRTLIEDKQIPGQPSTSKNLENVIHI
jgi:hypothetical protein